MLKDDIGEIEAVLDPENGYVAKSIIRTIQLTKKDGNKGRKIYTEWKLDDFRRFGRSPYIASSASYSLGTSSRSTYTIQKAKFLRLPADQFTCDWKHPGLIVEDFRIERGIVYDPGEIPSDINAEELLVRTKQLSAEWIAREKGSHIDTRGSKEAWEKISLDDTTTIKHKSPIWFITLALSSVMIIGLVIALIVRKSGKKHSVAR